MKNKDKFIEKMVQDILNEEIEKKSKSMSDRINEGEMFGSFDDEHGWYDENDYKRDNDFDFEYDEEEFSDYDSLMSRYGEKQKWFSPEDGREWFNKYQGKYGGKPFRVRKRKPEENEMFGSFDDEHGWYDQDDNIHTGDFDFEYDEEEFSDYDSLMTKHGDHQRWFSPKDGKDFFDRYQSKYGNKPFRVRKRRMTTESVKGKNKLTLTENELIDLIENIVLEQKAKSNIPNKKPKGLNDTERVLTQSKKFNDEHIKDITNKIKDYLKYGSNGEYEPDPDAFPKTNGQLKDMKTKSYQPSDAVEEYIENFAHAAGMENLDYDEIKPKDEWVDDNIKGSSKTGNNPEWANAEKTDLGDRIVKKKNRNLYSLEKRKGTYAKSTQPIDVAGEHKGAKSVKDIFTKLESTSESEKETLKEEFNKIIKLIGYDTKTQ